MGRDPLDGGVELHTVKAGIDADYKFRFFFSALIFAILSFAIQYPIKSTCNLLKLAEVISWFILILSGYFSLVVCGRFPIRIISGTAKKLNELLSKQWTDEILMWRLFYFSLFLLLLVKGLDRFLA